MSDEQRRSALARSTEVLNLPNVTSFAKGYGASGAAYDAQVDDLFVALHVILTPAPIRF